MTTVKHAIDPLWQCLCPSWASIPLRSAPRLLAQLRRPALDHQKAPRSARPKSDAVATFYARRGLARDDGKLDAVMSPLHETKACTPRIREKKPRIQPEPIDYAQESIESLYALMRSAAIDGKTHECRHIAEILIKERTEQPSAQMYNAIVLSNISHDQGSAHRVSGLLDEMRADGLQPDVQTCHAALKVLSVHVDHLLRTDILEYMSRRWFHLSEDGAHDVAVGLLREGLFEQGLERLDMMRRDGLHIHPWLLDMAVYVLCEANDISEAYRIMRQRFDSGELNISRSLWSFFLDKASEARHHAGTSLAWSSQVNQKYINPSSGICLNVLATAARAADAVMATETFTHLSTRGTSFQPIHYELLMSTYLSTDPPDLKRAITILTIMAVEKLEPSQVETRPLYLYLRSKPELLPVAFETLRELHEQDRKIPIVALNLLIECYVEQRNLPEAMKIYKQVHTFAPMSEGAQKTFANIETFNLLLKACRVTDPPDADQASFLVSELLALRIKPTTLTFDRLILVFLDAGMHAIANTPKSADPEAQTRSKAKGAEMLDWAYRHFLDMQALGWMPRFGTLEALAIGLAQSGDARCWDVLQAGEDNADKVVSWSEKGHWARKNVEKTWEEFAGGDKQSVEDQ